MSFRIPKSLTAAAVAAIAVLSGLAVAQPVPAETVTWTLDSQVAKGSHGAVILHGTVAPGWHVYSLKQAPEGPTPLLVGIAANDVAVADGAPTGSAPTKIHDPAFNLETQFYSGPFTLPLPVRFKRAAGPQAIPLDVRFQTCNGRVCQPPTTVHLSAALS